MNLILQYVRYTYFVEIKFWLDCYSFACFLDNFLFYTLHFVFAKHSNLLFVSCSSYLQSAEKKKEKTIESESRQEEVFNDSYRIIFLK